MNHFLAIFDCKLTIYIITIIIFKFIDFSTISTTKMKILCEQINLNIE